MTEGLNCQNLFVFCFFNKKKEEGILARKTNLTAVFEHAECLSHLHGCAPVRQHSKQHHQSSSLLHAS